MESQYPNTAVVVFKLTLFLLVAEPIWMYAILNWRKRRPKSRLREAFNRRDHDKRPITQEEISARLAYLADRVLVHYNHWQEGVRIREQRAKDTGQPQMQSFRGDFDSARKRFWNLHSLAQKLKFEVSPGPLDYLEAFARSKGHTWQTPHIDPQALMLAA